MYEPHKFREFCISAGANKLFDTTLSIFFFRLLYAIAKIAIITARIILHLISYPQFTYDLLHMHHSPSSFTGTYEPKIDLLPTSVASYSSVGRASHRYREVTGSSPVEVLNLFQACLRNCKNCDHNCEDHSSFDLTILSAVTTPRQSTDRRNLNQKRVVSVIYNLCYCLSQTCNPLQIDHALYLRSSQVNQEGIETEHIMGNSCARRTVNNIIQAMFASH